MFQCIQATRELVMFMYSGKTLWSPQKSLTIFGVSPKGKGGVCERGIRYLVDVGA
jgi:hypothetical protein